MAIAAAERRLGTRFPAALVEFHSRLGAADDLVRYQNPLSPLGPRAENGRLTVWSENQAVVHWAIKLDEGDPADPPVDANVSRFHGALAEDARWVRQDSTFSEFAVHLLVAETAMFGGTFNANGSASPKALQLIRERLPALPFATWAWPAFEAHLFGEADVLVETDGEAWIWLCTLTAGAYREWKQSLEDAGARWEHWGEGE